MTECWQNPYIILIEKCIFFSLWTKENSKLKFFPVLILNVTIQSDGLSSTDLRNCNAKHNNNRPRDMMEPFFFTHTQAALVLTLDIRCSTKKETYNETVIITLLLKLHFSGP